MRSGWTNATQQSNSPRNPHSQACIHSLDTKISMRESYLENARPCTSQPVLPGPSHPGGSPLCPYCFQGRLSMATSPHVLLSPSVQGERTLQKARKVTTGSQPIPASTCEECVSLRGLHRVVQPQKAPETQWHVSKKIYCCISVSSLAFEISA